MVWRSLGVIITAGVAIVALQQPQLERVATTSESAITQRLATAQVLGRLGFASVAASQIWLDFVQYFGHEDRATLSYRWVQAYLETITQLDPQFIEPYTYALPALAMKAADPAAAVALLDFGIGHMTPETNPTAFRLPWQAAVINFLFVGDLELARDRYYLAADWLEAVGQPGDGLRSLGDRLLENPRSRLVRFNTWAGVFNSTADPEIRQIALAEMTQLGEARQNADGTWELIPPPDDALIAPE